MSQTVKKRLSGTERRLLFLKVAAQLVKEGGTEALTMERLASASGVNKALPYRYFQNRDDVVVALFTRQNEVFDAALQGAMSEVDSFESALRALVNTWSAIHKNGIGLPSLQEARTANEDLETLRAERTRSSVQFIAGLIEQYHLISKQDALLAASVLFAGSRGLTAIWEHTDAARTRLNESFVKMAMGAVAAVSKSPTGE